MAEPFLAEQAARIRNLYGEAEIILLNRVAKRVARGITDPGWTEAKLVEVQALGYEARVATKGLEPALARELDDILVRSYERGAVSAGGAPFQGVLPRTHVAAVQALYSSVMSDFRITNNVILRRTLDIYRSVVAESSALAVAGIETRRQVTQRALDRWAMHGIRGFTDTRGRQWDLGSYSEMATRSAITNAHLEGRLGTFRGLGFELFVVSGGQSSCPLCNEWAGMVLSENPHPEAQGTLSQARSSGLFHPNCGHSINLYSRGYSSEPMTTKDKEQAAVEYEQRQQQRALERHVREWKRRDAVAISPEAHGKARAKVREYQGALRQHTARTGDRRLYYREQPLRGVVG